MLKEEKNNEIEVQELFWEKKSRDNKNVHIFSRHLAEEIGSWK